MKKTILTLVAIALLSGCATNGVYDGNKTALLIGTIIVGSIALSSGGSSSNLNADPNCPINVTADPNSGVYVPCP